MGVAYLIDKQPIFLTFKQYSLVMEKMRNSGLTSLDKQYSAEFGGKEREDLDWNIINRLVVENSDFKKFINRIGR